MGRDANYPPDIIPHVRESGMEQTPLVDVAGISEWLESHHRAALALSFGLAFFIALADWRIGANVSLGALYSFAIVVASIAMPRSAIIVFALACAVLSTTLASGSTTTAGRRIAWPT